MQLQSVDTDSRLQTGYAAIDIATNGNVTIGERVDLGLPGGQPMTPDAIAKAEITERQPLVADPPILPDKG